MLGHWRVTAYLSVALHVGTPHDLGTSEKINCRWR